MLLLLDIGNTHTHVGLAVGGKVRFQKNFDTPGWRNGSTARSIHAFLRGRTIEGASFCSVVPAASVHCRRFLSSAKLDFLELTSRTLRGVGIDYPKPASIGPDRLANALAVKTLFGAPSLVVDFGTAVTFDVVNASGQYVGGIIAPGLATMTDYLHEKTALLPKIKIRDPKGVIGKNTEQAMLIGAVHGYRGLVRGLILELKRELGTHHLPVVATGGYADLIAKSMPEISAVLPGLTLEGLRLAWAQRAGHSASRS
jgi:type III pantothenate kinase